MPKKGKKSKLKEVSVKGSPEVTYDKEYKEIFVDGWQGIFVNNKNIPIIKFGLYSENVMARDGKNPEHLRAMKVNIVTSFSAAKNLAKMLLEIIEKNEKNKE